MGERIYINNGWGFTEEYSEAITKKGCNIALTDVRIPHNVKELPFHYFDEHEYQMISGYRKVLLAPKSWEGKSVILTFDGVAHESVVYINGCEVASHHCGYTAFSVDISDKLKYGEENIIAVKVNSNESINVPPFGLVIDYMTYGGIYRDVYITINETSYIDDVFVETRISSDVLKSATISQIAIVNPKEGMTIRQSIREWREDDCLNESGCGKTVDESSAINESSTGAVGFEYTVLGELALTEALEIKGTGMSVDEEVSADAAECEDADEPDNKDDIDGLNGTDGADNADDIDGLNGTDEVDAVEIREYSITQQTGSIKLWDIEAPNLYELKTELISADGKVLDEMVIRFGYRKAIFKENGFYLNGRKVKLRGLNRHQSYAYAGYAMPESMQKLDADILKSELRVNAVRTSHYPQSQYFIDRCDELGLLVFTEIPGWQHIGDEDWKNQAIENVEDMIVQYRNHPSIILWGVRINESADDDPFYAKTNEVARRLDPTRQTGGVRCIKNSNLLEDVYTYNDFSCTGNNRGCDKKSAVTSDETKPYLISEYNGHMFPTKAFDWEEKRLEHAMRHARVLNDVAGEYNIAGSFGWCMFDYNTHKDFGSGDRICYHGVLDMFRNPKMASYVYACQQEDTDILEVSSTMDIGEHPGCVRSDMYIFTNADSVKMYKNGYLIKEYVAEDSDFDNLAHGPIRIDDYVGDVLERYENMPHDKAEAVKSILNDAARVGLQNMSKKMYAKAMAVSFKYHVSMADATMLYNKYVGDWGGVSTEYSFEAIRDGEVVKKLVIKPMTKLSLEAVADHTTLVEGNTYDVAAVRFKAVDDNGNQLPFANDVVKLTVSGPIELIGPDVVAMQGGMFGTYVKTIGKKGNASLKLEPVNGSGTSIDFVVC